MGRLVGRIFVGLTLFLITFIGYSSQIFIIWPWYGYELSVQLITLLLPFKSVYIQSSLRIELISLGYRCSALLYMILWNYYLCVTTNPGQVPKSWVRGDFTKSHVHQPDNVQKPDVHDEDGYEVKKLTRAPRFCRTCENYKPPRAHHCRQCKQ